MSGFVRGPTSEDGFSKLLDDLPGNPVHYFMIGLICAGHAFDVIEMVMSSVFATVFSADVSAGRIEAWELGLLMSAAGIGGAVGSPVLGSLSDRFGRRNVLIGALFIITTFSIAGALTTSIHALVVTRVIASFGIGSYVPISTTYLAEVVPARARGRAVTANSLVAGFGGTIAGLLAAWFETLGIEGWRGTMIVGGVGSLIVALLLLRVPESPRWLWARGEREAAKAAYRRIARLPADAPLPPFEDTAPAKSANAGAHRAGGEVHWTRENRVTLGYFIALSMLIPWALIGFPMLGGAILTDRGYSTQEALLLHSFVVAGISVGSVLNLFIVDRVPRDLLLIASACGAAAATILFGFATMAMTAMIAGMLMTACLGIYHQVLLLHAVESFPPLLRGRVPGICFGVNRGIAILVPLTLMPLLKQAGEVALQGIFASVALLSAVLILLRRFGGRPPEPAIQKTG